MGDHHTARPPRQTLSRREALVSIGTLALSARLSATGRTPRQTAAAASADWPQFRGNPRLTGVAAGSLPLTPKLLWSYEAGDVIDSSAAIVGDTAYVGAGDGHLLALDFASGKLRWKYPTGALLGESSPTIAEGLACIGDMDGGVHAVNLKDGGPAWTFKTASEIKASPVFVRGMVLIGSYDTHLYALDAKTGRLRWKLETGGPVHATLAVLDDVVFVAGCDSMFRAISVTTGKQAYEIDAGAYIGASPVVEGDRAWFGTYESEVLALDLRNRQILWRYSDPSRQFPFYSSAALSNGRIIIGGRDKYVHSIDAASGKAAWTFATRARVDSSPVVAAGRIYVGSSDGTLYVLDEAKGQKVWEFDAGDAITASPALSRNRLIISSRNGVVYCLG